MAVNALEVIESGLDNVIESTGDFVSSLSTGAKVAGGAALVATTGGVIALATTRKKRKAKTKRGRARDRKYKSKQKHEQRYKRKKKYKVYGKKKWIRPKKKSKKKTKKKTGKIYYTKNGQPYKILASGKARFVKGRRKKR